MNKNWFDLESSELDIFVHWRTEREKYLEFLKKFDSIPQPYRNRVVELMGFAYSQGYETGWDDSTD